MEHHDCGCQFLCHGREFHSYFRRAIHWMPIPPHTFALGIFMSRRWKMHVLFNATRSPASPKPSIILPSFRGFQLFLIDPRFEPEAIPFRTDEIVFRIGAGCFVFDACERRLAHRWRLETRKSCIGCRLGRFWNVCMEVELHLRCLERARRWLVHSHTSKGLTKRRKSWCEAKTKWM